MWKRWWSQAYELNLIKGFFMIKFTLNIVRPIDHGKHYCRWHIIKGNFFKHGFKTTITKKTHIEIFHRLSHFHSILCAKDNHRIKWNYQLPRLIYIINQSFNIVLFNVLWGCYPKPKVVLVCFFNDLKIFYPLKF